MITKWLVLSVVLTLCGCSSSRQVQVSQPHRFAWDGLGRDPNLPVTTRTRAKAEGPKPISENRDAELAKFRPFSREWVNLLQAIDAEDDARISKLMIICRGCELASREANRIDPSSSLTPNQRTTEAVR
jgi:hypothetical protein